MQFCTKHWKKRQLSFLERCAVTDEWVCKPSHQCIVFRPDKPRSRRTSTLSETGSVDLDSSCRSGSSFANDDSTPKKSSRKHPSNLERLSPAFSLGSTGGEGSRIRTNSCLSLASTSLAAEDSNPKMCMNDNAGAFEIALLKHFGGDGISPKKFVPPLWEDMDLPELASRHCDEHSTADSVCSDDSLCQSKVDETSPSCTSKQFRQRFPVDTQGKTSSEYDSETSVGKRVDILEKEVLLTKRLLQQTRETLLRVEKCDKLMESKLLCLQDEVTKLRLAYNYHNYGDTSHTPQHAAQNSSLMHISEELNSSSSSHPPCSPSGYLSKRSCSLQNFTQIDNINMVSSRSSASLELGQY